MKKVLIIVAATLMTAAVFTSCKKDETKTCKECDCTYVVTFVNDGNVVNEILAAEGSLLKMPTLKPQTGYKFDGWYTDNNKTNQWDFAKSKVVSDTTLYANWREVVKLVQSITDFSGSYVTKYEYDAQDRIKKTQYYDFLTTPGDEPMETNIFYYESNELVKIETERNASIFMTNEYEKEGNTITQLINQEDKYFNKRILELNSQGYTQKVEFINMSDGSVSNFYTFEYENGNITKVHYERSGYTEDDNLKYDKRKSPLYHCKTPKWYLSCLITGYTGGYHSRNNVVYYSALNGSWEFEYEMEYDDDGYPVKKKHESGQAETYTYYPAK